MRRWSVWLALAATLCAVYFAPDDGAVEAVGAVARQPRAADLAAAGAPGVRAAAGTALDLRIRPRDAAPDDEPGDLFSAANAAPAAMAAAAPQQAPEPAGQQAPPLPVHFLGRLVDGDDTAYFLRFQERDVALHVGEKFDQNYTFDSVSGGTLTFTYLPLNQKQTLVVGEVN